jgi:hypothetical protein
MRLNNWNFNIQLNDMKPKVWKPERRNNMFSILVVIMIAFLGVSAMAQTSVEPIKKVEVGKNREFVVNGKPFFPIMSWAQNPKSYARLQALGINTHCGGADAESAKAAGCYAVPGFERGKSESEYILAYIFDDEPDMPSGKGAEAKPRQTTEKVNARCAEIKAADPNRLLFMTFTGNFTKEEGNSYPEEVRNKMYPEYIKGADVAGFDIYPIYGSGYAAHLNWVGSGVSQLCKIAGKRPVYTWVETSKGSKWMTYEKQPDVLTIHTRNEVWQAIINGATAIGYFTHAWRPEFKEFAPTEEMQKELLRINTQITRLTPAILAGPAKKKIEMAFENGLYCQFKATENEGSVYIFALNSDLGPTADKAKQFDPISPRAGKATFTVASLKAGTKIEVIDEKRTITAGDGTFTDEFSPLAEHIYKMKF